MVEHIRSATKARVLMLIEITLIFFMLFTFLTLGNILVGIYAWIFIISLLLWVLLFIVTVKLFLKTKRIKPE
ncbi:MAG: hypothetical protein KGD74_06600 [Candidatus Lokiarchaeota archaeon]|nr:hypothetical protein [Candidatus Lokiarchaeota archaeon]